jgi:hypothetical protein
MKKLANPSPNFVTQFKIQFKFLKSCLINFKFHKLPQTFELAAKVFQKVSVYQNQSCRTYVSAKKKLLPNSLKVLLFSYYAPKTVAVKF